MADSEADEIVIVGYGALLPEADTVEAFWRNLQSGRCAIRAIRDDLWQRDLYFSSDPRDGDKSHSACAGFVDAASIQRAACRLGLSGTHHNRLQMMTLAATAQALEPLSIDRAVSKRSVIYFGCMATDQGFSWRKFFADEWDSLQAHVARLCPEHSERILTALRGRVGRWAVEPEHDCHYLFTSSVLALVKQRFGLEGEGALVDAACASSLAAIDLAMRALRTGQADLALTGGIDANLGPSTFVLFSRLGALARERCLPLDRRSEGLSQGEGAVALVLERRADAKRWGHPIHGIIKGCGDSSDGSSSSLFAPTSEGQLHAYEKAYRAVDPAAVDYVECHATGTTVGDETELRSLIRFFGDRALPIGSVKAQLGHTKGAAGAVSLLKCLLSLKHRAIPPSTYFRDSVLDEGHGPRVNTAPIALRRRGAPLTFGVSSFGFGGVNYHLVLQEASKGRVRSAPPRANLPPEVVVIGQGRQLTAHNREADLLATLRIPQRSLDQIDGVQLAALLATIAVANSCGVDFARLDRRAVTVISASTLGLELAYSVSNRVLHFELGPALAAFDEETAANVMAHKERHPPVTEDSGPGSLNNVIAGRVANHFDLSGPSFNIDADLASFPAALRMAELSLSERDGLVVLLAVEERYDREHFQVERPGVTCWLLASLPFAKAHNLPIEARLDRLVHTAHGTLQ